MGQVVELQGYWTEGLQGYKVAQKNWDDAFICFKWGYRKMRALIRTRKHNLNLLDLVALLGLVNLVDLLDLVNLLNSFAN